MWPGPYRRSGLGGTVGSAGKMVESMEEEVEKRTFTDEEHLNQETLAKLGYSQRPLVRASAAEAMMRRSQACGPLPQLHS